MDNHLTSLVTIWGLVGVGALGAVLYWWLIYQK